MSHPAEQSRREKAAHPERYCSAPRCLWKLTDRDGNYKGPCMSTRHTGSAARDSADRERLIPTPNDASFPKRVDPANRDAWMMGL